VLVVFVRQGASYQDSCAPPLGGWNRNKGKNEEEEGEENAAKNALTVLIKTSPLMVLTMVF